MRCAETGNKRLPNSAVAAVFAVQVRVCGLALARYIAILDLVQKSCWNFDSFKILYVFGK